MRIVHVASRLAGSTTGAPSAVCELARAQARLSSGRVQVAAAGAEARRTSLDELELRTFPCDRPGCFGRSSALRHHLANCPLEIVHAHCLGERGLHYAHLAAQRHGAPLIVSPSLTLGLGPGERLRLRCLFQRLVLHPRALENAAGWHATCSEEAEAIRACGFHQPVCIAPPGIAQPSAEVLARGREHWLQRFPNLAERPVVLGAGPTSRLRRLVETWTEASSPEWTLLLVTPEASAAQGMLAPLARRHAADGRILVAAESAHLPHGLARLFLGLGRTAGDTDPVAQALAAGLPALVSDDTPWSRIEPDSAGWCVPWRDFGEALRRVLTLAPEALAERGNNARELLRREFNWTHTAGQLLAFYRNLRR